LRRTRRCVARRVLASNVVVEPRGGRAGLSLALPPGTRIELDFGGDVLGCGLAALALERGGHVRVGLEDYAGDGTPTNVELVRAAAALVTASGRRVATPAETRALLG
jgi:hypothetical protein